MPIRSCSRTMLVDLGPARGHTRQAATVAGTRSPPSRPRPNAGWRAVPWFWVSFPATYNMAHFRKAGLEYAEDLGRAAEAGQGAQEAGQPVGIAISHTGDANTTFWSVLWCYGGKVLEAGRQDAGHQLREDRAGHRVVQGALQGRDGAGGPLLGRRLQQPRHPLRQVLLDPQSDQPVQHRAQGEDADRRRHQPPRRAPAGPAGIHTPRVSTPSGSGSSRKNVEPAKEFVQFLFRKENYDACIVAAMGFNHGAAPESRRAPDLGEEPEARDAAQGGGVSPTRAAGRRGPTTPCGGWRITTSCPTWWPRR